MPSYNDKIWPEDQVAMEEAIAAKIFDFEGATEEDGGLGEEECAELGRDILLMVLAEFRPDLVEEKP